MRRHSPPRSIRHRSPPKRRGRVRSLSPLSRSQPAPPGEERGRKPVSPWDAQTNRNKRFRSRSRPREWLDREPPIIHLVDNEGPRGLEPPRNKVLKDREPVKSRESNRERVRSMHQTRDAELKDAKHKHHQGRQSPHRILNQPDDFEESYLDHQPNHYGNHSGIVKNRENMLDSLNPISFNAFVPDHNSEEKPRDIHHQSSRNHHQLPRDIHRPLPPPRERHNSARGSLGPSSNRDASRHGKEESSVERINRLEKLVEKLVENNVNTGSSKDFGHQPSKDIISELIPSNSKFTTSMWLNMIHDECLDRNYDEKSSIMFVQDKMTGIMKAWFKSVSNYDFTWPELKLLITKTFPDNVDFAQTLKLLVARDKAVEETITQYFFSKVYLCEACKVTGENAVSCLIDGLSNPFMKQDIKSHNFLTPEALYSEYLSKFPENEVPVRVDHREVREVIPEYSNDEYIALEMDNRERDYHVDKVPYHRRKCFTCKKFGHATVDCRHAPICYNCKKKGHIASKCHYSNALLISSVTSVHTAPKIKCNINGQEYLGLIDTGSVAVTLREWVVKDLGLPVRPTTEVLKGYGGSMVVPLGEAEVLLNVDSTRRKVKALIIEDEVQQEEVIIGQSFLSQNGVTFYQKNGKVGIFDSGINHSLLM